MKILCVSDQIDPLVYSAGAKQLYSDVDMVLCAGDLAMEYIDYIVTTLNKPTFFVFGNHNLEEFNYYDRTDVGYAECGINNFSHCHGAIYAGFKVIREQKLLIAGCSGSMKYNRGKAQYTNKQMYKKLLALLPKLYLNKLLYGRYVDIFLTHASPLDIHDKPDPCHKGFKCYRWFLKKFKPRYMIHGHIHLYDQNEPRVTDWENTTIINAFSHYILEFESPTK